MSKLSEYWSELRKDKAAVEAETPKIVPGWEICECCQQSVDPSLVKHFDKKAYHRKCFRKNVKMAMKAYGFK